MTPNPVCAWRRRQPAQGLVAGASKRASDKQAKRSEAKRAPAITRPAVASFRSAGGDAAIHHHQCTTDGWCTATVETPPAARVALLAIRWRCESLTANIRRLRKSTRVAGGACEAESGGRRRAC
eukprot:scaffold207_cov409-Prasinococcus_capsulatus_cf.AAC.19